MAKGFFILFLLTICYCAATENLLRITTAILLLLLRLRVLQIHCMSFLVLFFVFFMRRFKEFRDVGFFYVIVSCALCFLFFEFCCLRFFEKYKDIQWTTDYATEGRRETKKYDQGLLGITQLVKGE
ncbi:hypothetical protein FPQ18DRAFT_73847 [Pyronema domesticum]|nr:hypothetical protein FPQ18DRAFT_73847 [Pyronema domesticum]